MDRGRSDHGCRFEIHSDIGSGIAPRRGAGAVVDGAVRMGLKIGGLKIWRMADDRVHRFSNHLFLNPNPNLHLLVEADPNQWTVAGVTTVADSKSILTSGQALPHVVTLSAMVDDAVRMGLKIGGLKI